MRRIAAAIFAVLLIISLAIGAAAATGATGVSGFATVSADGSCQITLTATLHLEGGTEELIFPIPADATNVTLNGSRVRASKQGDIRRIDLSDILGNVVGDFSVSINYTLQDVIHTTETDTLELQLPLLSGFAYPVETMDFSVTLPGTITGQPAFSSGYHQTDIEKDMTYTVSGATVSGSFTKALKDHETLLLTLPVTEEMFPQSVLQVQNTDVIDLAMGICAALALLYWLIFLRNAPPRRQHCAEPPEGYSAGEMGCVLLSRGADLSMMVLTWAQLGYILIQLDRHGRALLHKRMDMGNERGELEQRCFKKLFGKRRTVDTSGDHYAELCRMVAKRPGGVRELMHPRTGNLQVFRFLASGIGLFGGVSLGAALSGGAALQGLVVFLLAVAGAVGGWLIQSWAGSLLLWDKRNLWTSLGICGAWLLLSLFAGQFITALWVVIGLLVAGVMIAFGGRRTELGRQTVGQVLDLRRYLRTVSKAELQRICASNPEYFFQLAPHALALGTLKSFAKRFGSTRLPGCPWLTTGMDAHMTAQEWAAVMDRAVEAMETRRRQLPMEKFLGLLQSFRR